MAVWRINKGKKILYANVPCKYESQLEYTFSDRDAKKIERKIYKNKHAKIELIDCRDMEVYYDTERKTYHD